MFPLPSHWSWQTLEDTADVILGQSPPGSSYNTDGLGVPFFQGKAEFGDMKPTVVKWTTDPKRLAETGDVLLSVRAPVGPTNVAPFDCCVGRGLAALRAGPTLAPGYLLYWMRASADELASAGTGTTFKAVSGKQVRSHPIPVPPIDEQRRIVEAIETHFSHLDAGVESLERAKKNVERMRASILDRAARGLVIDAGESSRSDTPRISDMEEARKEAWAEIFPEKRYKPAARASGSTPVAPRQGWLLTSLDAVVAGLRYGTSTKCDYEGPGDPVLRIPNVRLGRVTPEDMKRARDTDIDLDSVRVREGDLLFIRTNGSRDLIGRVGVVAQDADGMAFASYLIRGRPIPGVDAKYLGLLLESPPYRDRIVSLAATSAGQYNISASKLASIPIVLPTLAEQRQVVEEVERQFSVLEAVAEEVEGGVSRANQLRRSVLASAFAGRLRKEAA